MVVSVNEGSEVIYTEKSAITGRTFSYSTAGAPSINPTEDDKEMFLDDVSAALAHQSRSIYHEAFFVVMPLFCGYASLFSLQGKLSDKLGIVSETTEASIFSVAVSMLYIGNLFFRLGHNIFFFFCSPRYRVLISMSSMLVSMAVLTVIMFWDGTPNFNFAVTGVFIAYILGGVAVGSFESNILATISGTHESTKVWAIIAMPVGVNTITIGAFLLFAAVPEMNPGYTYIFVFVFVIIGILIFFARLFRLQMSTANNFSLAEFFKSFLFWREWAWHIKWNALALMFDMFCVSLFSPGIELYLYNFEGNPCVDFWGYKMSPDTFIAIYNMCFFIGDTSSRKLLHMVRIINPFWFLLLSAAGVVIGLSGVPEIVPLCAFLVSFANGSIYVQSTMVIKSIIVDRFILVSLSTWLFVGDIGSVVGSNIRPSLQKVVQPLVPVCTK